MKQRPNERWIGLSGTENCLNGILQYCNSWRDSTPRQSTSRHSTWHIQVFPNSFLSSMNPCFIHVRSLKWQSKFLLHSTNPTLNAYDCIYMPISDCQRHLNFNVSHVSLKEKNARRRAKAKKNWRNMKTGLKKVEHFKECRRPSLTSQPAPNPPSTCRWKLKDITGKCEFAE